MKRLLLGTIAALAVIGPAVADDITLRATADNVLVDTLDSGGLPFLDVSNTAFGSAFNLNSLTLNSRGSLTAPDELKTNTLDVQGIISGMHTLVLDIVASGLTGTGSLQSFLNEFSVTGLTSGWSVTEQTKINGVVQATTPAITANSASADVTTTALESNPFSAEAIYTISTNGLGSFNGGIDIQAVAVPSPILGAGIPGLIIGLGVLGFAASRRQPDGAVV
jgi:hypothetical protein